MNRTSSIAYLILAHGDVRQLELLIEALRSPRARFFIHIDKKSDIGQFAALAQHGDVQFCEERLDCAWGDFSLVEATLAVVRAALAHPSQARRLVLLSGACLPVQPTEYVEAFFDQHASDEFIECFDFPDTRHGKPISRVEHYWLRRDLPPLALKFKLGRLRGLVQGFINRRLPKRDYRQAFQGLSLHVGSQWWALSRAAAEYVAQTRERQPGFYEFVQNTDCPDEFFFQTVLANSDFRGRMRHSLTYTSWRPGATGPQTISSEHLEALRRPLVKGCSDSNGPTPAPEVLFARKFSSAAPEIAAAVLRANEHKLCELAGHRALASPNSV